MALFRSISLTPTLEKLSQAKVKKNIFIFTPNIYQPIRTKCIRWNTVGGNEYKMQCNRSN